MTVDEPPAAEGGVGEPGKSHDRDVQDRFKCVTHNLAVSPKLGLASAVGAWICLSDCNQDRPIGSKMTPSRGREMYEAEFEHHLGGTVVKTRLIVTTQRKWAQRPRSRGWSTCRIGRLIFALNARLTTPATTGTRGHLHFDQVLPSRN